MSDTTIPELHAFARVANLRYLSFGLDHYDVPEELHASVVELGAEPVDSRHIVRVLRASGLRAERGKQAKRWVRTDGAAKDLLAESNAIPFAFVAAVEAELGATSGSAEVVVRPGEMALVASGPNQPRTASVTTFHERLQENDGLAVATPGPWGWALELVVPSGAAGVR